MLVSTNARIYCWHRTVITWPAVDFGREGTFQTHTPVHLKSFEYVSLTSIVRTLLCVSNAGESYVRKIESAADRDCIVKVAEILFYIRSHS